MSTCVNNNPTFSFPIQLTLPKFISVVAYLLTGWVYCACAQTIPPLPPVSGIVAGSLQAQFAVNESGAASYTIPLAIPPGTAGMAPQLSLSYESDQGNALLGIGWSLSGLSSISRCPTTLAQEGYIDGVDFDTNDRFCMDGQRLVAVNGVYGGLNTEYKTENESFARINSSGQTGNGPTSFTVYLKNGLVYVYGATIDSRVIPNNGQTSVLNWLLSSVHDRRGNYYTITYTRDAALAEHLPLRIDYTRNDAAGLSTYNSVRFE